MRKITDEERIQLEVDYSVKRGEYEPLARGGDEGALIELFKLYHPEFMALAFSYLKDYHLSEDSIANAYERAWLNFPGFRGESEVRTWLYRIVVNESLKIVNKRIRDNSIPMDELEGSEEYGEDGLLLETIHADRLSSTLIEYYDGLSDIHKEVLTLYEVEKLTYEEMAEALELPIGTVRSRLHIARNELAKAIKYNRRK